MLEEPKGPRSYTGGSYLSYLLRRYCQVKLRRWRGRKLGPTHGPLHRFWVNIPLCIRPPLLPSPLLFVLVLPMLPALLLPTSQIVTLYACDILRPSVNASSHESACLWN